MPRPVGCDSGRAPWGHGRWPELLVSWQSDPPIAVSLASEVSTNRSYGSFASGVSRRSSVKSCLTLGPTSGCRQAANLVQAVACGATWAPTAGGPR
jgi:hypothetical protein